jgi:hypothetical protein
MLILPIKKQWFDMIKSGEKKEEYREIKAYYTSRLAKLWCNNYLYKEYNPKMQELFINWLKDKNEIEFGQVMFRNGYSADSDNFIAQCGLRIGTGRTEWGAMEGTEYYIFSIEDIIK